MNEYYIYHLIDPITDLPFYIGKGKNKRMYYHEKCVKRNIFPNKNRHLFNKIKNILDSGLLIKYKKVYENLSEQDAWKKEIEEEEKCKNVGIKLCNLVPCGCGGDTLSNHPNKIEIFKKLSEKRPKTLNETWRKNIGIGMTGLKHSEESKLKKSEKMKGKNNPMFGRHLSQETKKKISNASKNKTVSDETRQKLRLANLGKIRSEETRQRMSNSKKGVKMSDKAKENISKGHLGLIKSEETRKKIGISNTGKKRNNETRQKLSILAKKRIQSKNPNFRPISQESIDFITLNINKPIYWIYTHLIEKMSYGRIQRRVDEIKMNLLNSKTNV